MNKKTTSYHKLFRYIMIMTASVLMCIGALTVTVSLVTYRNTKLKELNRQGDLFVKCLNAEYLQTGNLTNEAVFSLHSAFSQSHNLEIYVYSKDGKCVLAPEFYSSDIHDDKITYEQPEERVKDLSEKEMSRLNDSKQLNYDKLSFSSKAPKMHYSRRIYLGREQDSDTTKMYVSFSGSTKSINSFITKVVIFYVVFALLAFYVVWLITSKRFRKFEIYENDFHKITEMYARGDFSEKLPTDLDPSAKEIAEYINALAANVEKSEETSKTFIANVSHELRTPITTVGGFVDGILDGTIPKSRQYEYLVLVSKEIHRLKILISSMLNMSRFESGTLTPNFKTANITELVIQTVLMFEKKIESKNIEIEGLDCGKLTSVVDVDLMQQVIYNLVENAVKFVNEGGTISFRFEKTPEWFEIGIRNTGEGLKNDEIQQVFDRFYKTDSSRGKDTTGLGLGLSISRKIVHLHKGHIVVKSVYGEYTEFIIQLPLNGTPKERTNDGR